MNKPNYLLTEDEFKDNPNTESIYDGPLKKPAGPIRVADYITLAARVDELSSELMVMQRDYAALKQEIKSLKSTVCN